MPRDFRLWVCVHEQTHRIQFASAPWLTGYLLENIHEYMRLSDMSTQELFSRLAAAVRAVRSGDEQDGIIGAFHSGEQKVVFDRLTAVMYLKARQYAQGATFVRAVMADGGMPRLNAVWESPDHLPTRAEIEDPALWLKRL